jgi:hypothetical protein
MFEVTINRGRRLITFRASGTLSLAEMKEIFEEAKWATDSFKNDRHIVLADMRGLSPMSEDKQKIFGEIIRYGRERGTACCVHLSDSSVARLQHARIAREASPYDDITVNVVSSEEAEKLIAEKQASIGIKPR